MLPQTGEIIMKWLPYIGIAIIVLLILFLFIKRRDDDKEESADERDKETKRKMNKK